MLLLLLFILYLLFYLLAVGFRFASRLLWFCFAFAFALLATCSPLASALLPLSFSVRCRLVFRYRAIDLFQLFFIIPFFALYTQTTLQL